MTYGFWSKLTIKDLFYSNRYESGIILLKTLSIKLQKCERKKHRMRERDEYPQY